MDFYIFNTLGRKKEIFKPIRKGFVSIYHCGPTVYWTQHIGNMRAVYFSDIINRAFKYAGNKTTMVRNYTDVGHLNGDNLGDADSGEDRMELASRKESLSPDEIAKKYIEIYKTDISKINSLPPDFTPKATEYILEMQDMINTLLEKKYAYICQEAIYFDTSRLDNYTELSNQKLENNKIGTGHGGKIQTNKKNSSDFALWFFKTGPHINAIQTWDSPWEKDSEHLGVGFPGWHIECSAMSRKILGESFDIHLGGIEHIAVHHTNEIAQSESANGKKYVNYWIHNEHLKVDGKKMSKSEGTSFTIKDLEEKGYSGLDLRYFFLQAHYRSQQNFTWESLDASKNAYLKVRKSVSNIDSIGNISKEYKSKFDKYISDDFNTSGALSVIFDILKDKNISDADKKSTILEFDKILGLNLSIDAATEEIPEEIILLADKRLFAREKKDWQKSDELRLQIELLGYSIKDIEQKYELSKK